MGERYGLLPSQVLARADTFDMWVFDVSASYRLQQQRKNSPDYKPGELEASNIDQDSLVKRMEKFREQSGRP